MEKIERVEQAAGAILDAYQAGEGDRILDIWEAWGPKIFWEARKNKTGEALRGSWNKPPLCATAWQVAALTAHDVKGKKDAEECVAVYVENQLTMGLMGREQLSRLYQPWIYAALTTSYKINPTPELRRLLRAHVVLLACFAVGRNVYAPGDRCPTPKDGDEFTGAMISQFWEICSGWKEDSPHPESLLTRFFSWPARVLEAFQDELKGLFSHDEKTFFIHFSRGTVGKKGTWGVKNYAALLDLAPDVRLMSVAGKDASLQVMRKMRENGPHEQLALKTDGLSSSTPPNMATSYGGGNLSDGFVFPPGFRGHGKKKIGKVTAFYWPKKNEVQIVAKGAVIDPEEGQVVLTQFVKAPWGKDEEPDYTITIDSEGVRASSETMPWLFEPDAQEPPSPEPPPDPGAPDPPIDPEEKDTYCSATIPIPEERHGEILREIAKLAFAHPAARDWAAIAPPLDAPPGRSGYQLTTDVVSYFESITIWRTEILNPTGRYIAEVELARLANPFLKSEFDEGSPEKNECFLRLSLELPDSFADLVKRIAQDSTEKSSTWEIKLPDVWSLDIFFSKEKNRGSFFYKTFPLSMDEFEVLRYDKRGEQYAVAISRRVQSVYCNVSVK